ncbi:transcription factor HMG box [Aspergillus fumigatus]|nr:transcription factor HMG box [Aspergillus fumigatus]
MPRNIIQGGSSILRYLHRSNALIRPSRVAIANGFIRRICVSTNSQLVSPTLKTFRPSVILSRPLINSFATTITPDDETETTKSTGSKTGKKNTKKRSSKAATKAKPKPRKKLTDKQKEAKKAEKMKELVKQLKKTALEPPKKLIENPWNLTIATVAKGLQARGVNGTDFIMQCSQLAQSISAEERERIATEAEANKAANAAAYEAWIQQHTPRQIRDANAARRRLNKIKNTSLRLLHDDRQVKRPRTAYLLYMLDRTAEGDFKYMTAKDISVRLTEEWKGLTATEKERIVSGTAENTLKSTAKNHQLLAQQPRLQALELFIFTEGYCHFASWDRRNFLLSFVRCGTGLSTV